MEEFLGWYELRVMYQTAGGEEKSMSWYLWKQSIQQAWGAIDFPRLLQHNIHIDLFPSRFLSSNSRNQESAFYQQLKPNLFLEDGGMLKNYKYTEVNQGELNSLLKIAKREGWKQQCASGLWKCVSVSDWIKRMCLCPIGWDVLVIICSLLKIFKDIMTDDRWYYDRWQVIQYYDRW